MIFKPGKFHTDAFTRGGQIFSHEWRMKFQNFRNVVLMGLVCAVMGITVSAIVSGLTWWLLFDFYTLTYLSGKIKICLWSWMQPTLIELDVLLRALMKGSRGIPSAYKSLSQLISDLDIPGKGRLQMRTLAFLEHPWVLSQATRVHTVLLWGLGCFGAGIVSMIVGFRRMSRTIEADKILRGKEIEPLDKVAQKVRKAGQPDFEIAPGLPLPLGSENQHLAIVGATRMGKTTCILHLLKQVRQKGQRAVILDSTGELTARFYSPQQDILINPLDERSSSWDIWGESLEAHEYDAWASAMIPEGRGDPIWHGNARKLLAFTAQKLGQQGHPSMQDILKWCCWEPLGQETAQFYQHSPVAALMRPEAEKTAAGVRMQTANSIAAFEYLQQQGKPFSVTRWVKDRKDDDQWLFLMARPTQRNTLAPLLASLFGFSFMGLEKAGEDFKNRLWMVADEVAGWDFPVSSLKRLVTEGAKYGACCVLGFQNKSQIDHLYHHSGTKTLLSNCSTKVIFRSQDHETARDLSLTLGEQDILSSTENFSIGSHHMRDGVNLSSQQRTQATISATDIMSLEKLEAYVLLSGNFPAVKVRFSLPTEVL
jgi:type IV conjugative transfer system coupling protein TraD